MSSLKWYNEPDEWSSTESTLIVKTKSHTDFWRHTEGLPSSDNGHFYYTRVKGDFTAQVKVSGAYKHGCDQAGLMVRSTKQCWLKCGIELLEKELYIMAVITREYSDASIFPIPSPTHSIWLRIEREDITIKIFYALDGKQFILYRTAFLTVADELEIGIMCASPLEGSFETNFSDLKISAEEAAKN